MESPKIDSAELLLKNIELYNTLKSLVFCSDNTCTFHNNSKMKILLYEIEDGIFSLNKNMLTKNEYDKIINQLRAVYKGNRRTREDLYLPPTTEQETVVQKYKNPILTTSEPIVKPESPKFPFTASTFQTTINAITSGRIKWSVYNEQRRADFQNYFKQKYGYDFAPTNDEDAKNILLIRTDKDKTQGGKNKKSKKMRIRKLKKSQRK